MKIPSKAVDLLPLLLMSSLTLGSNVTSANEFAEDAAGAVAGALGSVYGGPSGAAAGALAAKYGVRQLNEWVEGEVTEHFDALNQEFVDETGFTLESDGKVFRANQPPQQQ